MTINSFHGRYRFLSNYYNSPISYEGLTYPTLEAAFQAAKTTDPVLRKQIAEAPHPAEARRLGRRLKLRLNWNAMRVEVMRELLAAKFSNLELASQLIETGDAMLIEGNPWGDTFWGVSGIATGPPASTKSQAATRCFLKSSTSPAQSKCWPKA